MGVKRVDFPLCALERLVVIKFPRVDLFSFCRIFTNSFPFSNRGISQCSTLGAPQHSSIPHREIPLRFREPGLASWGRGGLVLGNERNFEMGNRGMLWGLERGTWHYPAIRKRN